MIRNQDIRNNPDRFGYLLQPTEHRYQVYYSKYKRMPGVIHDMTRGVNSKFWLHLKDVDLLVKSNRGPYDGIGEVLCYKTCEQVGYGHRCVNARQVTIIKRETDDKKYPEGMSYDDGVVLPSYLRREWREARTISGKSLINERADYIYENQYGQKVSRDHTLSNYLETLRWYRETKYFGDDVEIYNNIERRLKFMCLLDYMTCQSDRHWENLEFILVTDQNGKRHLKLAKYYDNSHVFGLHRGPDKITSLAQNIRTLQNCDPERDARKIQKITDLIKGNYETVPMFGIITPTYKSEIKQFPDGAEECISLSKDKAKLDIFVTELAQMLLQDPELMRDYQRLRQVDYAQMLTDNFDQRDVPEDLKVVLPYIASKRVEMLDQALLQCQSQVEDGELVVSDTIHIPQTEGRLTPDEYEEMMREQRSLISFTFGMQEDAEDGAPPTDGVEDPNKKKAQEDDGQGGQK